MVFGNRSIAAHLARGALGGGALWVSLATMDHSWLPSLLLMPFALWMFKGCPVCWTAGLFESLANRIHQRHQGVD